MKQVTKFLIEVGGAIFKQDEVPVQHREHLREGDFVEITVRPTKGRETEMYVLSAHVSCISRAGTAIATPVCLSPERCKEYFRFDRFGWKEVA